MSAPVRVPRSPARWLAPLTSAIWVCSSRKPRDVRAWMTSRAHSESPPSSSDESAPSANPASLAAATLWSLPSTSARKAKRLLSRISAGVASRSRSGESKGSTPCSRAESYASGIPSESASIAPSAASSPSACGPPRRMIAIKHPFSHMP